MALQTPKTADRIERAREALVGEQVDMLLVSPSADLAYLTAYGGHASERPTLLAVLPDRRPLMLVPTLEAPRTGYLADVEVVPYEETSDPFVVLVDALGSPAVERVAISDQTWAAVLLELQRVMPGARFQSATPILRRLRMLKSPEEMARMERAGRLADTAFEELVQLRFAGRTEREVASQLRELLSAQGLELATWGPIVASGPNSASPHHLTGEREIHEGDALVLDFGGAVEGYQADVTRTVHVGTPDDEFHRVYNVVRQAQETAAEAVRPGVPAEAIDEAARAVIRAAGYGDFFIHRTGHGLGLDTHEEPYIVQGNALPLEAGMTFSVEPGIYLPGRFGVRIEDSVAVTETGVRSFNHASKDLLVVH